MFDDTVHMIFSAYESMFSLLPDEVSTIGELVPFPKFSQPTVLHLFAETHRLMQSSPVLISIPAPCVIVGDIHGNFHDLMRILTTVPEVFTQRFIFLGDYVDRGKYGLDVLILLFSLYVLYSNQFFLLRGNHEFSQTNKVYGFRAEILERYGEDTIWASVDAIFQCMPLAALVDDALLCLHGGIGPRIHTLDDIRAIRLPLETFHDANVEALVWSDPVDETQMFAESERGRGFGFGATAIQQFLAANNLECLIRAHQCVAHGVSFFAGKKCITVFSSSNYAGENAAAFLYVNAKRDIFQHTLAPKQYVRRLLAQFVEPGERKKRVRALVRPNTGSKLTKMVSRSSGMKPQISLVSFPFFIPSQLGLAPEVPAEGSRAGRLRESASDGSVPCILKEGWGLNF
jgi:diadenosine tetraphosphatase ApaH/serine/threonine PP2A family protein phosphatase